MGKYLCSMKYKAGPFGRRNGHWEWSQLVMPGESPEEAKENELHYMNVGQGGAYHLVTCESVKEITP